MGFDPLHIVRSSWPDISTKIIEKAPSNHLCSLSKSRKHASAQALRPITFSQRFRTARHLFKLMSRRRVSSDHPGMKNIPGVVSIFCLWTNWIHLLTCGKIEFRELYYLHFRSLSTRVVWPKIVFGLWRLKRRELENNQTIFETCVLNPLRGQKIKENLFWRKVKRTAFSESGTYLS